MNATLTDPRQLPALLGIPLSDEQLRAATAPLQPQLVVAGAGTGKTTVMAARVVWLVGTGQVRPDQVLGLTFTNQATSELRQRLRAALQRLPRDSAGQEFEDGDPTVLTYHAFAGRVVADFGMLAGIEADARLLGDGQRSRLAYRVACRPREAVELTAAPATYAGRMLALDDLLADLDVTPEDLAAFDTTLLARLAATSGPAAQVAAMAEAARQRLTVSALTRQFRDDKAAGEWIDFADQVRLGSLLARDVPLVGATLRGTFRIVLLDEYQDTSRAQRRMLQGLFGSGHAVTAVGDPCQAIYGWRGASVTNIDEFLRHFPPEPGGTAVISELTVNRRSRPAVLDAANGVATGLREFHRHVRPLRPAPQTHGGELCCGLLATFDDEVHWLGSQLADAGSRGDWNDIAVLCRTNEQVAVVVAHLRARGIPAHVASRRDLLALPEVVTVTTLLRVLVDPGANPDLVHQLTGPRWRIGPRDLAVLGRRAAHLAAEHAGLEPGDTRARDLPASLADAVASPGRAPQYPYSPEARTRLARLAAELDALAPLARRGAGDAVAAVVDVLAPSIAELDADTMPPSLAALVSLAERFSDVDGHRSLRGFVAYLDDCERFGSSPRDEELTTGDGITVMTVHAAKGLEFGVVAVPFLSAGVFPEGRGAARWVTSALAIPPVAPEEPDPAVALGFPGEQFTTKDHRAYVAACRFDDRLDEDRLAYVALTRAKDRLIASGHWWGPTQSRPRGPSPYLLAVRQAGAHVDVWVDEVGDRPEEAAAEPLAAAWPPPVRDGQAQELVAALAQAPPPEPGNPWLPLVHDVIADHADGPEPAPPAVVSTSDLTTWLRQPERFQTQLRRPMPRRPTAAAAAGTAFHAWVEHRMGQQALFELPGADAGAAGTGYEQLLARTRFADRTPHAVEVPFVLAVRPGLAVTGRIDAVFAVPGDPDVEWEVVDWKTGQPEHADPAQLAVYRSAWARLQGVREDRVRATFVFLADGSDRSYDDLTPVEAVTESL